MTVKKAADSAKKIEEEPPWLRELVEHGKFYRTCESHPDIVCNFYCINCMGRAFCPCCKSQHAKCGSRNILQAYKATGAATFRTEEMKTFWDISDICIYFINSKQIVFIQKKGRGTQTGSSDCNERCWNCSYQIRPHFKYCSIECKLEDVRRKKGKEQVNQACKRKSCDAADANSTLEFESDSCRKRPR